MICAAFFTPMSTFVAIDFETANHSADSACAVGLVRAELGEIVAEKSWLIRPPSSEFFFTHIHGITWADVYLEPTFGELWPEILAMMADIDFLAAHNSGFDRKVLHSCCDKHQTDKPDLDFVCTVKLARGAWNVRPTKLPNVCDYLGLELNHHDALSDSRACANIVLAAQKDGWSFEDGFSGMGERYVALD